MKFRYQSPYLMNGKELPCRSKKEKAKPKKCHIRHLFNLRNFHQKGKSKNKEMVKINTKSDTSDVRKKLKAEILSARKETTAEKEKVARRERANIKLNPDEKKTLDEMMREERWEGTVSSYIKTKIFIPRAKENPVPEARKAEAEDLLRGLNLRLEYLLKVQAKVLGKIETAVEKFQSREDRLIAISEYARQWKKNTDSLKKTESEYERMMRETIA